MATSFCGAGVSPALQKYFYNQDFLDSGPTARRNDEYYENHGTEAVATIIIPCHLNRSEEQAEWRNLQSPPF